MDWRLSEIFDPIMNIADDVDELSSRFEQLTEAAHHHQTQLEPPSYPPRHSNTSSAYKSLGLPEELANGRRSYTSNNYSSYYDSRNSGFGVDDPEGLETLEPNHTYFPPHYNEDLDPEDYPGEPTTETWHSSLYEDVKMDSARNSTEEAIFWRNRCAELELALQNFRAQANKVRGMLRDKLSEMEMRVLNAESRADIAEAKAEMMENQLRNMWESENGPAALSTEKDENIGRLEDQILEQRKLRVKDAQEVEAKAARIKEWVTNKLRDLEEQNQLLREQNQKCNEQLDILKKRLQNMASRHGGDAKEEPIYAQENGHRDSSSQPVWTLQSEAVPASNLLSCTNRNSMPSGLGLSGPVNQLMMQRFPNSTRASQAAAETRMSRSATTATEFASLPTHPLSPTPHRPKSQLPLERAAYMTHRSCLSADLSGVVFRPASGETAEPGAASESAREHHDYDVPRAGAKPLIPARLNNEVHDYAEIYTPSNERTNLWPLSTSLIKSGGGSSSAHPTTAYASSVEHMGTEPAHVSTKPPTPPLHRCPSWESRIYKSAAENFQPTTLPPEPKPTTQTDIPTDRSTPNVTLACTGQQSSRISDFTGYQNLSVPVFASVNGRASQIRSVPFTGDSSDSSDGEDGGSKAEIYDDGGTTDDYAIPPDAQVPPSEPSSSQVENHVPSHAHCSSRPVERDSLANIVLEKRGYLTKLGGKLKTWQKRWFVLNNGVLSYWKSQSDMARKPQGQIVLNENCQVLRAEDVPGTFEISAGKKTYYLNAESPAVMEEWIKALEASVRRRLPCTSSSGVTCATSVPGKNMEPTVQGWLTKVRHGHVKRCWCALVGRTLYYYKSPGEAVNSQTNMRETRVEEVQHMSDSDCEDQDGALNSCEFTIGIFPVHQDPIYLLLPNKQEKDSWLYHLTIVSGGNGKVGTQYEQLIQKLMEVDGDPACVIWRHPVLLHTKDHISSPLTTLPENLHSEAIKLFKAIQLFTSVLLDSAGIDYHVVLAQNALQQGLTYPDLQTELLAALVKQTTRHVHSKGGVQQLLLSATQSLFTHDSLTPKASTNSLVGGDRGDKSGGGSSSSLGGGYGSSHGTLSNTSTLEHKGQATPFASIQGWQLLALAVSLFVPKNNKMLWYLRLHLRRNTDPKSEVGKYAAYCQRALGRTLEMGGRTAKPSRMEVLSILLKNPYRHSLPHAIPVHFLNGTYQVVGFDGSTTVEEFLVNLTQEMKCRETRFSGFALYSDDPIEKDVEHWLHPQSKVCDVISKWETALREKGLGKFENTRVIQLTFRNRFYWRAASKHETERERLLLSYQINRQIMRNQFPVNRDLALELAAIMAQVEFGEYWPNGEENAIYVNPNLETVLGRFVPPKVRNSASPEDQQQLIDALRSKWIALKGRTIMDCTRIYLTCTRKWPFFGAVIFEAQAKGSEMENGAVCVAVGEDGLAVMDSRTLVPSLRIPFTSVVTFGGCQDDFMVVVNQPEREATRKLVFAMAKHKVLEITLLLVDYMNAFGAQMGIGTPSTTLKKSKAGKERVPSFACHSKSDSQNLASEDGNT